MIMKLAEYSATCLNEIFFVKYPHKITKPTARKKYGPTILMAVNIPIRPAAMKKRHPKAN